MRPQINNRIARLSLRNLSLPSGFSALQHRNYRLYFFGQAVSVTGTWMQSLAMSWLVLSLTPSAIKLSFVNVLQFAPTLLLGLVAGVVADRVPKRSLLVLTQSIAAICSIFLAVLIWTDHIDLWHVYLLALIVGINNSFDMPARQAFVSEMVDNREDLPNAIALNSTLFNMGRLVGPALAGLILGAFGVAACFTIDAFSYVAVIVSLLMMRRLPKSESKQRANPLDSLREGLAYVRSTPVVASIVVFAGMVGVFGINFNVWMPLLAKQELSTGPGGFGLLMSSLGIGSLAGALTLAFRSKNLSLSRMVATALILGTAEVLLGVATELAPSLILAMVISAMVGYGMTSTMAMANTVVQSTAPDELRGRVMSVYIMVSAGVAPLGAILAGAVAGAANTSVSILLGGIITTLSAIWLVRSLQVSPQQLVRARSRNAAH
ncbi:MAG: MFS transporter [Thermomicrobiales bacterium]|nr:MFS transporter [Thermomicrobiales bacterium]MCO5220080.1 MFS transporter [Thermomicrobiales bacterium]